jgi:hypothetical protein
VRTKQEFKNSTIVFLGVYSGGLHQVYNVIHTKYKLSLELPTMIFILWINTVFKHFFLQDGIKFII